MITSPDNAYVRLIRSLCADRQVRRSERLFVIEGVRLVNAALAARATLRLVLYDPQHLADQVAAYPLLDHLATLPNAVAAGPRALAAAADTVTPQGVVAVVHWPTFAPRPGLRLVLDAIQDPGNVGTLLRSAEAAGVGWVLCSKGTADPYSPKVVRSAMGAHFSLPLQTDMTWEAIGAALHEVPHIYAAAADGPSPYYAVDWHPPVALLIGSEAHGIGSEGRALATQSITIPMLGRSESLNAGVAGSIILFEALRASGVVTPFGGKKRTTA